MTKAKISSSASVAFKKDLESAFDIFNQCAESLTTSYRALETRVTQLKVELESTRDEKLRHLAETERLAARLSDLLSALPAGVVVIDGRGVIQECNPAAEDLLGIPLEGELWRNIIARAFEPGGEGNESILRDERIVSISTCPLGEEPGQIIHLLDVTETRRLNNSLAHYKRLSAMGEMSAKVAHQIRTPLSAALLYTSQLTQFSMDEAARTRLAHRIMSRLKHMEEVVEDMLTFSRSGENESSVIYLSDLVEEITLGVEAQIESKSIHFDVINATENCQVRVNRHALANAIQNLITNSIQICGEGCKITITTELVNQHNCLPAVDLVIQDNGPGIAREIAEQVFEPFFTTREQGTGLGLAVTKAVVESSGGSIWVDQQYTTGARFCIRLPVHATQSTKVQTHEQLQDVI